MPNSFVKATRIVRAALGLLEREIVLPQLVWRDAFGDFAGAAGDTISVKVPAYATSRTRVLRSATPYTIDSLTETKVDLTLDTDVYKAVGVTDEELTLDVASFSEQVMQPVVRAVARGVEDAVAAKIASASYKTTLTIDTTDPYKTFIDARKVLNDAQVPQTGRAAVVGSNVEAALLKSDHLARWDGSGSDSAFRDAVIGRIAGFTIVTGGATLDPNVAVVFHSTAFALSMRAPAIPDGVAWGASESFAGLSMRVIRDYDFTNIRDRLLANVYIGTGTVSDVGYTDANGIFIPADAAQGAEITLATSAAADDILDTTTAHGFVAGDRVVFYNVTGGTGLTAGRAYYVIAANLAAQTFQVSTVAGGSAVNFTSDITAGKVRKEGATQFVRAVKLVMP